MIVVAHQIYRFGPAFSRLRSEPIIDVSSREELLEHLPHATVLAISNLWRTEFLERAPHLQFIQSTSAGMDWFEFPPIARRGIRLASAQTSNEAAVAEHAIALMLSLTRHLHYARDNQAQRLWRTPASKPDCREAEVNGKTLTVVGLGRIGRRVVRVAKALGMRTIGVRRTPRDEGDGPDEVVSPDRLLEAISRADVVVLTCPLTAETDKLIGIEQLSAMKTSGLLINVARGRVVDQSALISALQSGVIAGAALDCFVEEPLPPSSPLWGYSNVLITPHSAGNTQRYEDNVAAILAENIARLEAGASRLLNQVNLQEE